MTAARLRLAALLLAVLAGLSGLVGVTRHPAAASVAGDAVQAVVDGDPHVLPEGDTPAIVRSAGDHLRSWGRHDGAPVAVLAVALAGVLAAGVVTVAHRPPGVRSSTTAHVRRRGPPLVRVT